MSFRDLRIQDIQLLEEIGSGANATVFRGSRGDLPVAVKILRDGGGTRDRLDATLRFRQEATALARLDHRGVVEILEVGEADGRPYLVMEHVEGRDLAAEVAQRGPMPTEEVFDIATQLAEALVEVHRHGLIHRDIKPSNVVRDAGQVKLIDFGLAQTRVEDDTANHEVAGTLLYASPEQIRVTQGGVDGRADLYALGGTLFFCATGRPPFQSDDPGKLIQMHAAIEAPTLSSLVPAVDPILDAIVAKLLAKDPMDRYQSAAGLLADLQQRDSLTADALGRIDFLRSGIEVPLVGRTSELAALGSCRERLDAGRGAFVLVEGPSGTGKSRLARELVDSVRDPDTLVLSAKCSAGETTPFGPLRDALDRYISRLMWRDDPVALAGQADLRTAAGSWGSLLKRLSPGMGRLLENVPDVATLDPRTEPTRFYDALAEFIAALASEDRRVVMLLDDVQWLDQTSPEVLTRLADLTDDAPLLIVMTARNQGRDGEAVAVLTQQLGEGLEQRISLEGLSEADAIELVSRHLGGRPVEAAMAARIVGLSQGNPFAISQYVRTLVESGALALGSSGWYTDTALLGAVVLTNDVVQLVVDRIQTLQPAVVRFAVVGALLGSEFSPELAVEVQGCSRAAGFGAVGQLVRANLLEWSADGRVAFVHDRIREAMVAQLSEADRRDVHQSIATVLEAKPDPEGQFVFDLARHYTAGHAEDNIPRVFEASLAAGNRALDSYAYQGAFDWLQGALRYSEGLDVDRETMMVLRGSLGVAATRIGELQFALEQLALAIESADRPIDRARLHLTIATAHATESRFERSWDTIEQALGALEEPFPADAAGEGAMLQASMGRLAEIEASGEGFGSIRDGDEVERQTLLYQLYATASMAGLMTPGILPTRVPLLIVLGRITTHHLGACREATSSHTWYGLLLGLMGRKEEAYQRIDLAIAMAEQLGDPAALAHARMYRAWTYEMAGDILLAEPMALEVESEVLQYLGAWDYAQWAVTTGYQYLIRGYPDRAINFLVGRLERTNQTGNLLMQTCAYLILYSQLTVIGRESEGREFRREWQELYDEEPDIPFLQACKLDHYMLAAYEQGDLGAAIAHAREMLGHGPSDYWTWAMWLVIGYIALDRVEIASPEGRADALTEFEEAVARALATSQPPVHACHLAVLRAAAARLEGRYDDAPALLDEARRFAHESDSPWALYEAAREEARLAGQIGDPARRRACAERALRISIERGYVNRAKRIREEFGVDLAVNAPTAPTRRAHTATRRYDLLTSRRANALLEVSIASASSLEPKAQARAALDAIVRELGAERGFLLLLEDDHLQLRAGRTADGEDIDTLRAYSSTVIGQVLDEEAGLIATGSDEGQVLGSESAVVHNLRSIMAAPIKLQGRMVGVIYVDSRLMRGLFVDDDLDFLKGIGSHVAVALETARMAQRETVRVAMEKDLALTGSLQSLFLPQANTIDRPGQFRIAAHYRPMTQCSGDFWWYDGERADPLLIVGDVTGHGAGAAMMAVSAMTFLSSRSAPGDGADGEGDLLVTLDRYLHGVARGEMAIALQAIAFDADRTTVRIYGAAALPTLHMTADGVHFVDTPASLPIGYGGGGGSAVDLAVSPGDRLFVFTDGLLEMPVGRGRQLGIKGVHKLFAASRGLPLEEAIAAIASGADDRRGDCDLEDDLSFFVVAFD